MSRLIAAPKSILAPPTLSGQQGKLLVLAVIVASLVVAGLLAIFNLVRDDDVAISLRPLSSLWSLALISGPIVGVATMVSSQLDD